MKVKTYLVNFHNFAILFCVFLLFFESRIFHHQEIFKDNIVLVLSSFLIVVYIVCNFMWILNVHRHQRWPLGYGREITYWWGTSKNSKTVKMLAKELETCLAYRSLRITCIGNLK